MKTWADTYFGQPYCLQYAEQAALVTGGEAVPQLEKWFDSDEMWAPDSDVFSMRWLALMEGNVLKGSASTEFIAGGET